MVEPRLLCTIAAFFMVGATSCAMSAGNIKTARSALEGESFLGNLSRKELLAVRDARLYQEAMRAGRMLSEQVWDRAETPDPEQFQFGRGTTSATPLVWSHAQFIRLAIAIKEGKAPDMPAPVASRYLNIRRGERS